MEYCQRNGLSRSTFKAYKEKFGLTKRRKSHLKAFVKIEPETFVPTEAPKSSGLCKEPALPDARWVAEFVQELMRLE